MLLFMHTEADLIRIFDFCSFCVVISFYSSYVFVILRAKKKHLNLFIFGIDEYGLESFYKYYILLKRELR